MLLYQHQNRKDQIFRRLKSYHQQILIISSLMWIILLKDYIIHNVSKKKKKNKTKQNIHNRPIPILIPIHEFGCLGH